MASGATLARAETGAGPRAPAAFVIPHGTKDLSLVPSGRYTLDPNHLGIIVKVSHLGFSLSIFRFERASATLDWNHDAPEKSKLDATVEAGSIATNVVGFAAQLSGAQYLNAAKYPQASFASTVFRRKDATHGSVEGTFTLMGHSKPVTFDATLIGAGPGFAGGPVMGHVVGIEATTTINPQDYGLPAIFTDPIEIVIDTEFDRKPK